MTVDRDSVAMGDDVESHERTVEVAADSSFEESFRVADPDDPVPGPGIETPAGDITTGLIDHALCGP